MDISRLQTFCRVFELRSFSKAASELFLSQPTVSSHIAALESELGSPLFDRIGRSILPTQAGKILYGHAREVSDNVKRAWSEISLLQQRVAGELSLGGSTIPGHYLLPEALGRFKRMYPEVDINLEIDDSRNIQEKVAHGQLDLGVTGAEASHPDLSCEPLMYDHLVIVGQVGYFPDSGESAYQETLRTRPWIIRERGSGTRAAMEAGFKGMGLSLQDLSIAAVVHSTEAVLRCVQSGLGVSLTSFLAARELQGRPELKIVNPPGDGFQRAFYILRHRHRTLYPATERFVPFLKQHTQRSQANKQTARGEKE